jgi:hypothetical protein
MTAFCGIDLAENHHDIALVNAEGKQVARRRIQDTAEGLRTLLELLAEHGDTVESPVPVAIETGRGLLVACLAATGRDVVVINPTAAARYRERTTVSRSKSDALVRAVAVLARAGQDATWQRQQAANQLRSLLREYFPAALTAFHVKHIGSASAGGDDRP